MVKSRHASFIFRALATLLLASVALIAVSSEPAMAQSNYVWTTYVNSVEDGRDYGFWDQEFGSIEDQAFEYNGYAIRVDYLYWDSRLEQLEFRTYQCLADGDLISIEVGGTTFTDPHEVARTDQLCADNPLYSQRFEFHNVTTNPFPDGTRVEATLTLDPSSEGLSGSSWTTHIDSDQDSGDNYGYRVNSYGEIDDRDFVTNEFNFVISELSWDDSQNEVTFRIRDCLKSSELENLTLGTSVFSDPDSVSEMDSECEEDRDDNQTFEYHNVTSNPLPDGDRVQLTLNFTSGSPTLPTVGTPSNLRVTSTGTTSISLAWDSVDNAASYRVRHRRYGTPPWVESSTTTSLSKTISNLPTGTRHEFQVQAMGDGTSTSAEWGDWSSSHSAWTDFVVLPTVDAPTTPTKDSSSSGAVTISWNAVTGVHHYQVRYRVATVDPWEGAIPVGNVETYEIDGLEADTQYHFQVRAYGDGVLRQAAYGNWSSALLASTDAAPVTGCSVEALGSVSGSTVTRDGTWASDCESANRTGAYARFYSFTLDASAEVTINLTSDIDTYLFLLEGAGTDGDDIADNDDIERGNYDSRIVEELGAGSYTVEATTYGRPRTGDFTMTIQGVGCSLESLGTVSGTVALDGAWANECESARRSGKYARYYTFALEWNSDVTIDLESSVDTYLTLYIGEGIYGDRSNLIGENDDVDAPSDRDSRVELELVPGNYTIEASTYADMRTGDFDLTIQASATEFTFRTDALNAEGTGNGAAEIEVTWPEVPDVDSYMLEYRDLGNDQLDPDNGVVNWNNSSMVALIATNTESGWVSVSSPTSPLEMTGLNLGSVYQIRMKTVSDGVESADWVYGYAWPAISLPQKDERVATFPFYGHWSDKTFTYRICKSTFPGTVGEATNDEWVEFVESAIESWGEVVLEVDGTPLIKFVHDEGECSTTRHATYPEVRFPSDWVPTDPNHDCNWGKYFRDSDAAKDDGCWMEIQDDINVSEVRMGYIANSGPYGNRVLVRCGRTDASCVSTPNGRKWDVKVDLESALGSDIFTAGSTNDSVFGQPSTPLLSADIVILETLFSISEGDRQLPDQTVACPRGWGTIVHETGHALGLAAYYKFDNQIDAYLWHHPAREYANGDSVMSYPAYGSRTGCWVQPLDVLAITSLYQAVSPD